MCIGHDALLLFLFSVWKWICTSETDYLGFSVASTYFLSSVDSKPLLVVTERSERV